MINLGLILGVARSGTSWIHTVLSQSDTPMRSIKEPLRIFNNLVGNAPEFGMKDFRTFGDIKAFLDNPDHPFLTAIRSCMNLKLNNHKTVLRNDNIYTYCLIKEIGALLNVPSFIAASKHSKIILVVRDPLYVIDSLFSIHNSINYFCTPINELPYGIEIADGISKNDREYDILKRYTAVKRVQDDFYCFAEHYPENVYLVEYEKICKKPYFYFKKMTKFLKLSWGDNENSFLQETMSETKEGYYSIYRKTEDQIGRKFRFLSEKEVNLCKGLDNL